MTRWGVLLVAVCMLGAAACDDDASPTAPSSNAPVTFTVAMTAAQEVPAVTNAESTATGTATITLTPTRDSANAITGGSVVMAFTVQNFPAGSTVTLAHIHPGATGVTGGALVNTGLSAATAIGMPNGSASFISPAVTVDAATASALIATPQNFYFNVHTTLNPGGAVRGQLRAQ
jgi:hypothetical protein